MEIDILIDEFTPCLVNSKTGEEVATNFCLAKPEELEKLNKPIWEFNWNNIEDADSNVYKLTIDGDDTIQGLIATKVERGSVYINMIEAAPHNNERNPLCKQKEYIGVGAHLVAIAIELSIANEFGGFVHLDAKDDELVEYYKETFGAVKIGGYHPKRMIIDEENARRVHKIYTMEGEL